MEQLTDSTKVLRSGCKIGNAVQASQCGSHLGIEVLGFSRGLFELLDIAF